MTKRIIALAFIIAILMPHASAYVYTEEIDGNLEVSVGGNVFLTATLENSTMVDKSPIGDANFTTANHTFPYKDAYKITYKDNKGTTDYLITWKCNNTYYLDDYVFHDVTNFYSGYLTDNKTPVYLEIENEYVYGIIMDTQNVTCTEGDLVHGILGKSGYALSDEKYTMSEYSPSSFRQHYQGVDIEPYELVQSDPWAYYDYFDYEDNVDIDEYLYDEGYDE